MRHSDCTMIYYIGMQSDTLGSLKLLIDPSSLRYGLGKTGNVQA